MNVQMEPDFAHFLESIGNLDALDRVTRDLDNELKDSQVVMNEIKGMIEALPTKVENVNSEPDSSGLRHEDISNFLSASTPQLLMPDMEENTEGVNFEDVIAAMKCYAEDLKKNLSESEVPVQASFQPRNLEKLDLDQYAASLDQLSKRLSSLKLSKRDEVNYRNPELEAKLSLLCDDVNMFTKMIQAKTTLSETNKNWTPTQQKTNALDYENLLNKLLSGINEVSYLLLNKN